MPKTSEKTEEVQDDELNLNDENTNDLTDEQKASKKADDAMLKARRQLLTSSDYKKTRMKRINTYYSLYNGRAPKKLRQLFNVAIPIFPGLIDTLNAQHDSPIQVKFQEGDASDHFKVQKVNGLFRMEITNTSENSKWDAELRESRKDAIFHKKF